MSDDLPDAAAQSEAAKQQDAAQRQDAAQKQETAKQPWGDADVGTTGVCVVSFYLVLVFSVLIYCLARVWMKFDTCAATVAAAVAAAGGTAGADAKAAIPDIDLMCLVAIVGALGALIHAMRSFVAFVGNGNLKVCWLPMYLLLPFIGSSLALVFFLILKGILSNGTSTGVACNGTLGYLAVAGIVGLFTEETIGKIQEIAQSILSRKQEQKDSLPKTSQGSGS